MIHCERVGTRSELWVAAGAAALVSTKEIALGLLRKSTKQVWNVVGTKREARAPARVRARIKRLSIATAVVIVVRRSSSSRSSRSSRNSRSSRSTVAAAAARANFSLLKWKWWQDIQHQLIALLSLWLAWFWMILISLHPGSWRLDSGSLWRRNSTTSTQSICNMHEQRPAIEIWSRMKPVHSLVLAFSLWQPRSHVAECDTKMWDFMGFHFLLTQETLP